MERKARMLYCPPDEGGPAVAIEDEYARPHTTNGFDFSQLCADKNDESRGNDNDSEKDDDGENVEEKEQVHDGFDRDESDLPAMSKKSFLYSVKMEDHQWFLNQAPLTRGDALRNMGTTERFIFDFLIVLTPLVLLAKIWQFAQKSAAWLWARTGRITGSTTGTAVGQQRGTPIMRGPFEAIFAKFKGNVASQWGSGKEIYATQCYVNDFKRVVVTVFRQQRKNGTIQETMTDGENNGYFIFRNQKIPVDNINNEPSVEVRHYGLLIDPWNHQRGVSPDGVIFINGLAVGVLEVKCAYAHEKSLYVNLKNYYMNQLMCEMYIGHMYWPTIHWLDFVVWSPKNFTVDTYTFDTDYFYNWYAPREVKYYFVLFIKTLAEKFYLTAQQETNDITPSESMVQQVIERDLTLPKFEPPTIEPIDAPPDFESGGGEMGNPVSAEVDPVLAEQEWEKQLLDMDLDFADKKE